MQDLRWDDVTSMSYMKHSYVFTSHKILRALLLESEGKVKWKVEAM